MCYSWRHKWRCGDSKVLWVYCEKGNKAEKIPCNNASHKSSCDLVATCCCSTRCSQKHIDEKIETVVRTERYWGLRPGQPLRESLRKEKDRNRRRVVSNALIGDRAAIGKACRYHFSHCLDPAFGFPPRSNAERKLAKERPELPWRLGIPDRPEVSEGMREDLLVRLDRWDNSDFVKAEIATYYEWLAKQPQSVRQWEREMQYQELNRRTLLEYRQSTAFDAFRPILPATDNPFVHTPGAPASIIPPRPNDTPGTPASIRLASDSYPQPSSRSQSRSSSMSSVRIGSIDGVSSSKTCQRGKHAASRNGPVGSRASSSGIEDDAASDFLMVEAEDAAWERR